MKQLRLLLAVIVLGGCASTGDVPTYFSTGPTDVSVQDPTDIAVISAAIEHAIGSGKQVVVARRLLDPRNLFSGTCSAPALTANAVESGLPSFEILEVARRACEASVFNPGSGTNKFTLERPGDFTELSILAEERRAKEFSVRYPGADTILQLAIPGYSSDGMRAVTEVVAWRPHEWGCALPGAIYLILLERSENGWVIERQTPSTEMVLTGGCDPPVEAIDPPSIYTLHNTGQAWPTPWP